MGIFTSNTLSSIGGVDYSDLPVLEGYDSVSGCAMAMIETQNNDLALFEATIMEDFKEISSINEGLEVINESAMDVLKKIKDIFMKLLQKIKSIFQAFIAKLSQVFLGNEKLYTKYRDQISKYNSWKKFKVNKYREIKGKGSGIEKIKSVGQYKDTIKYLISDGDICGVKITVDQSDLETDTIEEALINNRIQNSELKSELGGELKDMTKAFMDTVFEDAETKDEWTSADILGTNVGMILSKDAGGKFKKEIEAANKSLTDTISKIITMIDKEAIKVGDELGKSRLPGKTGDYAMKKISSSEKGKGKYSSVSNEENPSIYGVTHITSTKNLEGLQKAVANTQRFATKEQELISSFVSARLSATKFLISQARKVWSSVAAFSSMEHKNEGYEFYTAIGEASAFDFMSDMEVIGS